MKQESIAPRLDINAFAHAASAIAGQDLLSKYERLMQETQGMGADRTLSWSASGELRLEESGAEQVWLHLTVEASLDRKSTRLNSSHSLSSRMPSSA